MAETKIADHAPQPGPGYWDWRCLVCDQPVKDHAGLFSRLFRRPAVGGTREGSK